MFSWLLDLRRSEGTMARSRDGPMIGNDRFPRFKSLSQHRSGGQDRDRDLPAHTYPEETQWHHCPPQLLLGRLTWLAAPCAEFPLRLIKRISSSSWLWIQLLLFGFSRFLFYFERV